jgi:hypothetical protein
MSAIKSEGLSLSPLKEVLGFPFRDPNWQNRLIIGAALTLAGVFLYFIPIVSLIPLLFVAGYAFRVQRRAARSGELVLPPWDDWGGLLVDGLKGLLVNIVYLLPGLVCFFGGMMLYYVMVFAISFPMAFIEDSAGVALVMMLLMFASMALMFLAMFLSWVLVLLGLVPLPMATSHMVAQDELGAAFRLRQIWSLIKADKLGYFAAFVIVYGLGMIWYFAFILLYMSMVLCVLLPFVMAPALFYTVLVNAAAFGLTYRESAARVKAREAEAA